MNRREAASVIAAAMAPPQPERLWLKPNGVMPNNERLPVLLYRSLDTAMIEAVMGKNGWPVQWRNGVYTFHHYHSTAHEVLAFFRGEANLLLGGELPKGVEVHVRSGDMAVLPCGTGHCKLSSSSDFLVLGGYPLKQDWDLCREAPSAAMIEAMQQLPFPKLDPMGNPWK